MVLTSTLILWLFYGGVSFVSQLEVLNTVQQELPAIVQDSGRQEKAAEVVAEMKQAVRQQQDDYQELAANYLQVNQRYDITLEELTEVDAQFDQFWISAAEKQIDLRFRLRDQLSREEWKSLYDEID